LLWIPARQRVDLNQDKSVHLERRAYAMNTCNTPGAPQKDLGSEEA